MKSFLLLTFLVTAFAGICQQNCLITRVIDGDTYEALVNGKMYTVQLLNVDAPEIGQSFGKEAKNKVAALIQNRMVDGFLYNKDLYGRNLIIIRINGMGLDSILISRGWAYFNYKYTGFNKLTAVESTAKNNKLGIWNCANNIPPWIWRKLSKRNKRLYKVCQPLQGT